MDSELHSNNDISLTVPEELELQGIDDWYTKEGVYGANAYYCKSKKEGVPTEVKVAKRFFEQVKDGYHEKEFGPPPKVRKIERDIQMTDQRVTRLSNYLALDDEDMPLEAIPPDLGDERLNRLVSFLNYKFNAIDERFNAIDVRFNAMDERFDAMDGKFDLLERRVSSVTARFENKFKGAGGEANTPHSYSPIINGFNQYPHENQLDSITSLDQIEHFNGNVANSYLEFYGLSTRGNLQDRRNRLIEYIGIDAENKMSIEKGTTI